MEIPKTIKIKLLLQRVLVYLFFPLLYLTYWLMLFKYKSYSLANLQQLRQQFKTIIRSNSGAPLLICPNHLTYIDSIILVLALGSVLDYMLYFKTLVWNFPKTTHIRKNLLFLFLGYFSKCIFIELDSPPQDQIPPIDIAKYLLSKQEFVMIFPEGHRSITGRVDTKNFAYGIGKIIKDLANIKVLCIYLRGHTQTVASKYPNIGDDFYCKLKLLEREELILTANCNQNSSSDLRVTRSIAGNVVKELERMEEEFFNSLSQQFPL